MEINKQEAYIKERVDDQIKWFNDKSGFNQRRYKLFRTIVIILSVSIPFAAGYIDSETYLGNVIKIAVGVAGVLIAVLEGIQALNKYQENWVQYRTAAENLIQEKMLFATQSGIYANSETPFSEFVARVEGVLSSENKKWGEYAVGKDKQGSDETST